MSDGHRRVPDTVVVGAGLAGLVCAPDLCRAGWRVALLEASDGVGGRMRTDRRDGFLTDRGFQAFNTSYPQVKRRLQLRSLRLRPFTAGVVAHTSRGPVRLADPTREPGAAGTLLPGRALSARDLAALAVLTARAPSCPSCVRAVRGPSDLLGGLDAAVTAFGTVACSAAEDIGDEVAEHLMAVNHLAPAALFRAAPGLLGTGSAIGAVTGAVAQHPRPRTAGYSVFEVAPRTWTQAVRRETWNTGVRTLEVRSGPLGTGFAQRPVAGTAPPLPEGGDPRHVAAAVADALETDDELPRSAPDATLVVERRAR
jgi:NAD(P)-dependent dehydrogenase (short-subunit alcohol dehydrogenase family)